jgi:phage gp36-like protein
VTRKQRLFAVSVNRFDRQNEASPQASFVLRAQAVVDIVGDNREEMFLDILELLSMRCCDKARFVLEDSRLRAVVRDRKEEATRSRRLPIEEVSWLPFLH